MSLAALARKLLKLESLAGAKARTNAATLELLRRQPEQIMLRAGLKPDPWQRGLLTSHADQILILASRQVGKSAVAAALALGTALLKPNSPVLLLSPTLRQSGELFRKVVDLFNALGRPVAVSAESGLRLELTNGSRLISLPGNEGTVRGFSGVAMLIIDEAARVADPLYYSVRPMLAVSHGRLVALSTPFGKRGWFHDEWHSTGPWQRVRITAEECPRISRGFLAEERRALGERFYRQEYLTSFEDVIDAVFSYADIQAAISSEVKPLFPR
jgi:hypothetical protein